MAGPARHWLLALIALLPACVQTRVETFRRAPQAIVDEAWYQPGASFEQYRRLRVAPLEIYFAEGEGGPAPETLARLREIFAAAFRDAIASDYPLTSDSGPDVLGVRASLVDLKHSPAGSALPLEGRAAQLVANGQLTLFLELTDTQSGAVLARAADRERPPSAGEPLAVSDPWDSTAREARRWAQLLREFLDRKLGPR